MVNQRGFTLMELVIAMVIIGILTAIAIPNYTAYIQRSTRAEARSQVLEAVVWVERFRTEQGRFDLAAFPNTQTLPIPLQCVPRNATGAGTCRDYTLDFEAVTPITYVLRATPVAGSRMAGDVCLNLRVTQAGLRDFTGGSGTQDVCWNR